MKKIVLSLFAALSIVAAFPAWTAPQPSEQRLWHTMQTYYKNPDPKRALGIVQQLITHPIYMQRLEKTLTFNYWGASALQKYPDQTMVWCHAIKQYDTQTQLHASGLFFLAQTPDTGKCLESLSLTDQQRQQLLKKQPINPLQQPITHPLNLDFLWMHFFATGNTQAVVKIADYAIANRAVLTSKPEHPTMEDAHRLLLEQAARWSLGSNAQQDEYVRQILLQYAQTLNKTEREWLEREVLSPETVPPKDKQHP